MVYLTIIHISVIFYHVALRPALTIVVSAHECNVLPFFSEIKWIYVYCYSSPNNPSFPFKPEANLRLIELRSEKILEIKKDHHGYTI